jgi:hypothetical protein
MSLLVVAYPDLDPKDQAWIQAIRARHDPHVGLIAPHVTLVFPNDAIDATLLQEHAEQVCQAFGAFRFLARVALIVRDQFSPLPHLFLVPDEGFSQIVRLHDALYRGPLAESLLLDVPFIPHLTIGAFETSAAAKAQADAINSERFVIDAAIERMSVIEHIGQSVTTIAEFALASRLAD